jgi:hypothetical protein
MAQHPDPATAEARSLTERARLALYWLRDHHVYPDAAALIEVLDEIDHARDDNPAQLELWPLPEEAHVEVRDAGRTPGTSRRDRRARRQR